MHSFCHPGGCCLCRLECSSCGHLGFRQDAFNRHGFKDSGSLGLCSCQHKPHISTRGLRLLLGVGCISADYLPSTIVASDNIASTPGATVSA
jgi:hypothetical protein